MLQQFNGMSGQVCSTDSLANPQTSYSFGNMLGKILGTVGADGEKTKRSYILDRFVNYFYRKSRSWVEYVGSLMKTSSTSPHIERLSSYRRVLDKREGTSEGGVYIDSENKIYLIKACQFYSIQACVHEIIASHLIYLLFKDEGAVLPPFPVFDDQFNQVMIAYPWDERFEPLSAFEKKIPCPAITGATLISALAAYFEDADISNTNVGFLNRGRVTKLDNGLAFDSAYLGAVLKDRNFTFNLDPACQLDVYSVLKLTQIVKLHEKITQESCLNDSLNPESLSSAIDTILSLSYEDFVMVLNREIDNFNDFLQVVRPVIKECYYSTATVNLREKRERTRQEETALSTLVNSHWNLYGSVEIYDPTQISDSLLNIYGRNRVSFLQIKKQLKSNPEDCLIKPMGLGI